MTLTLLSVAAAPAIAAVEDRHAPTDWTWGPLLPERRTAFSCCAVQDSIVTVGGTFWATNKSNVPEKNWLSSVYQLKLGGTQWQSLPDYPNPIDYALVVRLKGRVHAIGGQNTDGPLAETYSIDVNDTSAQWRRGPQLPRPLSRLRGGAWGSVIVAVTDEYSTIEAADSPRSKPCVLVWDTEEPDGDWTEIAAVPEPTIGFRAAAVLGENLFLFGGASEAGGQQLRLSDQVWRYGLQTKQWHASAPLPSAMRDATAIALDERYIAVAGGVEEAVDADSAPDHQPRILLSTRCLLYDTIDDHFMTAEPLRLATADHGMAVLGGQLFVIGGEDSPYRTRTDLVQCCEIRSLIGAAMLSSRRARDETIVTSPLTKRRELPANLRRN